MPTALRPATPADVAGIARIYGYAVRESVATFDLVDPPPSYWEERIASADPGDHVLVVEEHGDLAGYAYSCPFRPRPAYARTRETSVYLAPYAVGRGLGSQVYARLLEMLRTDRIHLAVAVIAQPNPASVALHEHFGFERVGTFCEVGRKFDRWVDTTWYQLRLQP